MYGSLGYYVWTLLRGYSIDVLVQKLILSQLSFFFLMCFDSLQVTTDL